MGMGFFRLQRWEGLGSTYTLMIYKGEGDWSVFSI
jgi:hypothetical protein